MDKIIRCCIFDLGGTLIDKYSITPILSMKELFKNNKLVVMDKYITEHMGIEKDQHLELIMDNDQIRGQWYRNHGFEFKKENLNEMFKEYKEIQKQMTINHMKIIPQTWKCVEELKNMNILTGVTTGFDEDQTDYIRSKLENRGILIDNYEYSDYKKNIMRPNVDMIVSTMNKLDIEDPKSVLKIDDTEIGINEGKNAGCWTVGVYRWSSYMNVMSYDESIRIDNIVMDSNNDYNQNYSKLMIKKKISENKMNKTDANFIFPTVGYIPGLVKDINDMTISLKKYIK